MKALPSGAAPSPSATGHPVLSASPDAGNGGAKVVLTGTGFTPGDVVRVSFVVKEATIGDVEVRDLRNTVPGSDGAFSLEVLIPSDLGNFVNYNTYLRAKATAGQSETVFDLTR
ncbi:hypothetical protein [Kitasatospora sp. NPDC092286]|uniref:hypothetical protein n=1 Tax=Kitasatospora sp. NPDC092286 TaxID=3364087 RepID=UPI003811F6BE